MNLEKSTVISVVITLFPLSNRTVIIKFSSVLFYFFYFFFVIIIYFSFLFFLPLLLFFPIDLFVFEFKVLKLDLYSDVQFYLFRMCSIHHSQVDQGWVVQHISFIPLTLTPLESKEPFTMFTFG